MAETWPQRVLKSDDPARVIDILKGSGFDVYTADEAYQANQADICFMI